MGKIRKLLLATGLVLSFAMGAASLLPEALNSQEKGQEKKEMTPQEKLERFNQKSVDELVVDLQSRPGALHVIQRLRALGDKKAISPLKDAFEKTDSKIEKQVIASALLSLSEKDKKYFDYLVQFAKSAIESDMPFPLLFNSQGKVVRGKFNLEFLSWCKQNSIKPGIAARDSLYNFPSDVMLLAISGDNRAFSILLKGLKSNNYIIVSRAAQGLSRIQNKEAIKPIIEASKRVHEDAAKIIAESLILFDDPEAKEAAKEIIQKEHL